MGGPLVSIAVCLSLASAQCLSRFLRSMTSWFFLFLHSFISNPFLFQLHFLMIPSPSAMTTCPIPISSFRCFTFVGKVPAPIHLIVPCRKSEKQQKKVFPRAILEQLCPSPSTIQSFLHLRYGIVSSSQLGLILCFVACEE